MNTVTIWACAGFEALDSTAEIRRQQPSNREERITRRKMTWKSSRAGEP